MSMSLIISKKFRRMSTESKMIYYAASICEKLCYDQAFSRKFHCQIQPVFDYWKSDGYIFGRIFDTTICRFFDGWNLKFVTDVWRNFQHNNPKNYCKSKTGWIWRWNFRENTFMIEKIRQIDKGTLEEISHRYMSFTSGNPAIWKNLLKWFLVLASSLRWL